MQWGLVVFSRPQPGSKSRHAHRCAKSQWRSTAHHYLHPNSSGGFLVPPTWKILESKATLGKRACSSERIKDKIRALASTRKALTRETIACKSRSGWRLFTAIRSLILPRIWHSTA